MCYFQYLGGNATNGGGNATNGGILRRYMRDGGVPSGDEYGDPTSWDSGSPISNTPRTDFLPKFVQFKNDTGDREGFKPGYGTPHTPRTK